MMRSIATQAAGAAFNAVVGFALLVFLGRSLAPEAFAGYVALLSAVAVVLIAIAGGNPTLLYREGVSAAPGALAPRARLAVAQVLAATGVFVLAALFVAPGAAPVAMLCAGAIALAELVSARLRAQGHFGAEAGWQAAMRVASALAIVAAVLFFAREASSIFLAWLLAASAMLVLFGRHWLAAPRLRGLPAHLALVAPIVAVDALLALATKGDVALLSVRVSARDLADYAVCTRFTDAAVLAFAPVSNVQMRHLTLRRALPDEFARTWMRAAGIGLAAGALAIAASVAAGERVVPMVFGDAYAGAGPLLARVALALPFLLANLMLAQAMIAAGRERALALILALGAAAWVTALWLAARDGLAAAAVASACVHAVIALVLAGVLLRRGVRAA